MCLNIFLCARRNNFNKASKKKIKGRLRLVMVNGYASKVQRPMGERIVRFGVVGEINDGRIAGSFIPTI